MNILNKAGPVLAFVGAMGGWPATPAKAAPAGIAYTSPGSRSWFDRCAANNQLVAIRDRAGLLQRAIPHYDRNGDGTLSPEEVATIRNPVVRGQILALAGVDLRSAACSVILTPADPVPSSTADSSPVSTPEDTIRAQRSYNQGMVGRSSLAAAILALTAGLGLGFGIGRKGRGG